jgi:perosamine synthetase
VDVGEDCFNTPAELVERAITSETRLVVAVHTFGFPVDVLGMRHAAAASGAGLETRRDAVHIIEDACEALGAEVCGRKAGSLGEAGLLAFYPNKQITTGEGGVLLTSNSEMARKATLLRNQGRDPSLGWLDHVEAGFSYRLPETNCALGISQLRRIDAVVAKRQQLAEAYDRELARIDGIIRPPLSSSVGRISWFVYPIRLAAEFSRRDRDRVCESMLQKGIAAARYFAPLHRQPVLRSSGYASPTLPKTDALADRVIALPFFNELTLEQIQEVCGALRESLRELRRNA